MIGHDVTPAIVDWEPQSKRSILERGASYNDNRSLSPGGRKSM